MRIILTHEQTDFDGLASLLGAARLDESAIPLLPRRANRNVRAFITLYGADLPFIDPRDLPAEPIEAVILVDTQSLTSIKGMEPNLRVRVIDHHTARPDLPADWQATIDETGANTTLLVEALQEQDQPLSVIQATLLLLGIYEDTGALTYTRTTPRDIRAAAYLLEQGANLAIANDFLNHPLSLEQQAVYDQLRQSAETHLIHGQTVIVAPGEATGMDEELSTIAHKLRDLLDPDALILLINIRGGVQLIARSTSDSIDVAGVAAHFGGGGHPRAAAALIKSGDRAQIHQKLIAVLPNFVHPTATIAEIMSYHPRVLAPDTPVHEAAQLMQRYGYEGYPVVAGGQIVGLLTRRAVDRAISHKLNLPTESLMEAGTVHVHPDQPIEYLQAVMTETGWGQIPVVERETHRLLGIVTRTDLLKTLTPAPPRPDHRNLAARLEKALPPSWLRLLAAIAEIAQEQRSACYIVGGFVRDLLLDRPSPDFDIVVEGDAISLARAVGQKFDGRVTIHRRFGTAKWFLPESLLQALRGNHGDPAPPESLDFITARTEFYTHPTALPTVERGSIKLDLHRRDFTINTLALRLDGRHYGELLDYWGGLNDLRQGLVRVLHSLSFVDDPTRMLRAVRYEQRYQFTIGPRTLQLLLEARPLLDRISGDRIRHEIDNMLAEERFVPMLERLAELGLLAAIHTDLIWDEWIRAQFAGLCQPAEPEWKLTPGLRGMPLKRALAYALWLIRLSAGRAQKACRRLKLPRYLADVILAACQLWADLPSLAQANPSAYAERLHKIPVLAIYAAYRASDDVHVRQSLQAYVYRWQYMAPQTSGHDLRALGLPPGPHYKAILTRLRQAWLDGEVTSAEQEKTLLATLIAPILQPPA